MKSSIESGELQTIQGGLTIADGISVKTPGKLTFDIIRKWY